MSIVKVPRLFIYGALIAALSIPVFAEGPGQGCPEKGPMPETMGFHGMGGPSGNHSALMLDISELEKLMNEINISKSETPKIIAIARSFITLFNDRIIKVQREELNIKEELLKDKPDLQAIQSFINKKTQQFSEIEFAQIKRDIEIKSLLSQDEYDRWKSAMAKKMRQIMPRFMQNQNAKKESAK